jgi:hypothetical protein
MSNKYSRYVIDRKLIDADRRGYHGALRKLFRFTLSCRHTVDKWCCAHVPSTTICRTCEEQGTPWRVGADD